MSPGRGANKLKELTNTVRPDVFKHCRETLPDHRASYNDQWQDLLEYVRKRQWPNAKQDIDNMYVGNSSYWILSKDVFNVISGGSNKTMYDKRIILAEQDGNGFRLYKHIHEELEGGDVLTTIAVRNRFLGSPAIDTDGDLINNLDERSELDRRYGPGMDLPARMA